MLIFITFLANSFNICITGNETNQTDCTEWLPNDQLPDKILFNSTDFSKVGSFNTPNQTINLGIGNVPDLLIDLSTLVTIYNYSDNIEMIVNVTRPDENDILTFDFEANQFDDLLSLTFNNLQLKPYNKSMIHTTSTIHTYKLILNGVFFHSGYAFDSDLFQPIAQFDFEDIMIVELYDRWENDIRENNVKYVHYPVFGHFFFSTDFTVAYNENVSKGYIQFENDHYHGKVTIITEYPDNITFILNSTDDTPTLGFEIYSYANVFNFTGGWNENISLNNDGIQLFYNGGDNIRINTNNEDDTTLPVAVNFDKKPKFQSANASMYKIKQNSDVRSIIINSTAETVTFTSPWNITGKTSFTRNNKSHAIIFERMNFCNETSVVYREDVKNKMFQVNELSIMDNLTYIYPGETDINIAGDFIIRPGVKLIINSKMRFDKNKAVLKIFWDTISGFPLINITDPLIIKSKGIPPSIVFTDDEPISNIANANETYADIISEPIKIVCGENISVFDTSKFSFLSPNPSFSEDGVWEFFVAPEDIENGNSSLIECIYVNMTDLPEVPIIPLPTATKDPAAVDKKAMIAMIVIFCFLFISGILGYFTKFLKQNKRDREKEKQDELEKLKNERDLSDSSSKFDDSEVTQKMSESDLSDRVLSFEHDLSIGSDDDFSTTTVNMSINQSNSISRKNTLQNESISAAGVEQGVKTKKKKRTRNAAAKTPISKSRSKSKDDVDTPLLKPVDDS